jgi:hypothetical protein
MTPDHKINYNLATKHIRENVTTIITPYKKDSDKANAFSYKELSNNVEKKMYNIKYLKIEESTVPLKSDYELFYENNIISQAVGGCDIILFYENNIMAKKTLELKVGTYVMCIANITTVNKIQLEHPILYNSNPGENQLVSGSLGIIIGFVEGLPEVKFNNIKEPIVVDYFVWNSEINNNVALSQIPLIYAWSITFDMIHNSVSNCINILPGFADNQYEGDIPSCLRNLPLEFPAINLYDCINTAIVDMDFSSYLSLSKWDCDLNPTFGW